MTAPLPVAVIGGGLTGLTAAYDLAKAGQRVVLLEKGDVFGGLAAGFTMHGTALEQAYHHIFTGDGDIIALMRELGLESALLWRKTTTAVARDGALHPFSTPFDLLRFPGMGFLDKLRLGLAVLYLKKTPRWRPFSRVTAESWMRSRCGTRAYEALWGPLLHGKFHDAAPRVSMAWLWARLHVRANSRVPGKGEELGYVQGGFQLLIDTLVERLRSMGVTLRAGCTIDGIVSGGGMVTLRIDGAEERYAKAVFTVPSPTFARLLPVDAALEEYRRRLCSIAYLGAVCCVFSTRQSLTPYYWVNCLDRASPFLVFVQHTNFIDPAAYAGRQVYYLGTYVPHDHPLFREDAERVTQRFFEGVRRIAPDFDPAAVEECHLFRFANAQHVVDVGYEGKLPDHRTPIEGIYLANFSQIYPQDRGTNFAVRDGRSIAEMVLEDLARAH